MPKYAKVNILASETAEEYATQGLGEWWEDERSTVQAAVLGAIRSWFASADPQNGGYHSGVRSIRIIVEIPDRGLRNVKKSTLAEELARAKARIAELEGTRK